MTAAKLPVRVVRLRDLWHLLPVATRACAFPHLQLSGVPTYLYHAGRVRAGWAGLRLDSLRHREGQRRGTGATPLSTRPQVASNEARDQSVHRPPTPSLWPIAKSFLLAPSGASRLGLPGDAVPTQDARRYRQASRNGPTFLLESRRGANGTRSGIVVPLCYNNVGVATRGCSDLPAAFGSQAADARAKLVITRLM